MRFLLRTSVRNLALFVGALILLNCERASAGYLPVDLGTARGSLFGFDDNDSFGSATAGQPSSSVAEMQQVLVEPADTPDQPNNPNARHNTCFAFGLSLAVRGHRSGTGAGGANRGHDSGGQPTAWSTGRANIPAVEFKSTVCDSESHLISSTTTKLFRPPRLS